MKINNNKELLVNALSKNLEPFKKVDEKHVLMQQKLISKIENMALDVLENDFEYTVRHIKDGYELIKQRVFWDENLNCWCSSDEEIICVIDLNED